jgi:hypothetical protein
MARKERAPDHKIHGTGRQRRWVMARGSVTLDGNHIRRGKEKEYLGWFRPAPVPHIFRGRKCRIVLEFYLKNSKKTRG